MALATESPRLGVAEAPPFDKGGFGLLQNERFAAAPFFTGGRSGRGHSPCPCRPGR